MIIFGIFFLFLNYEDPNLSLIEKDKYKTHILPVIKPLEKQKINLNLLDDILKRLKSTSIHTPKF